jgi:hypothetical protein
MTRGTAARLRLAANIAKHMVHISRIMLSKLLIRAYIFIIGPFLSCYSNYI